MTDKPRRRPTLLRVLAAALAATAAAVGLVAGPASADAPSRSTTYAIDPAGPAADNIFPEGIAVDGDTIYVGSTTDGTIYRGTLGGATLTPFLPGGQDGRTSAIGLKAETGYLFVAGGGTGRFFIYEASTGEVVGSYLVDPAPGATSPTFLNDVAVAPDGTVYVTDSRRPVLYAVPAGDYATDGVEPLPVYLDFTGTALQYTAGFNVNGIAVSAEGEYLVLAQSNTGTLFRVRVSDGEVTPIDLGGASVSGDGLVLAGRTLYAVERQGEVGYVVEIRLSGDLTSGTVVQRVTDASFNDPTTAALARGRLLVVNSQFGERSAGVPPEPFTVSSIPRP